ncbi:MAG TPA: DUF3486 family protein [Pseudomonas sp.]|uniref:DUF3486 family protein n=1 Tax=Pseudomonas sp. TaxID=306 RepID=UPI002C3DC776|nr:DUF3486 family protein [Pseudomonas sp.]HWH86342.1 DUF3486 family protein [Pseudomonas sp.]
MTARSKVVRLPAAVKAWLDKALVENAFSQYQLLTDELAARGFEISQSSLCRYGKAFQEQLSALKMSNEQAKALLAASPDDEGAVSDALMRLTQHKLFNALQTLDIDPKKPLSLPAATKAVADLARATVTHKKWQADVREKARIAADAVDEIVENAGLTKSVAAEVRRKILGVAE